MSNNPSHNHTDPVIHYDCPACADLPSQLSDFQAHAQAMAAEMKLVVNAFEGLDFKVNGGGVKVTFTSRQLSEVLSQICKHKGQYAYDRADISCLVYWFTENLRLKLECTLEANDNEYGILSWLSAVYDLNDNKPVCALGALFNNVSLPRFLSETLYLAWCIKEYRAKHRGEAVEAETAVETPPAAPVIKYIVVQCVKTEPGITIGEYYTIEEAQKVALRLNRQKSRHHVDLNYQVIGSYQGPGQSTSSGS